MRPIAFPLTRMLLGLGLLAATVTPAGAAEPAPITFNFVFGNGTCLDGSGPSSLPLTVSLASADGQPKATRSTTVGAAGQWSACLGSVIRGGDVLSAVGGGTERTFHVPLLSADINRVTDVVRGTAPAGTTVDVRVESCPGFGACEVAERSVAVGSGGAYRTRFTSRFDIVGGDAVRVRWTSDAGDELTLLAWTPYLEVWRASSYFSGAVRPSQAKTIELRDGDGNLRGRGRAVGEWLGGWIEGEYVTAGGAPVHPRAGDRLTASFARDATLTVVLLAVTGDSASEAVAGSCGPDDYYRVTASRPGTSAKVTGRADAGGGFLDSFAGSFDLQPGDRLSLSCKRATGDMLHLSRRAE